MKARITFLVFGLLFCIAFSAQTQQHVHSNGHEAQLKKLIPNVPYIVYDQDSLSGYNEAAINSQAAQQQYSPDDTKRYQALMKRNFINTKYGVNAMAAAGSQNPPTVQAPCTNIDFEAGNTSGWTTSGDAAIMSGGGMDPYGNFPMVCPGGSFSLKLGNATNPTTSKASQTFAVTAANAYFVLRFAMVILNYPHVPSDAARVFIRFKDQSNNVIACPNFECYYAETSSGGGQSYGLTGFQTGANGVNIGNQSYPTTYVPWTTLGFDITPYIGQNITVEIENRWCVYNYDWAYCYVDGLCSNLTTSATGGCQGTNLLLSAPLGMDTYNWAGPAGSSVSTIHTQTVSTTVSGVYTVTCIPYSTCGSATYVYTINAVTSVPPTANFNYTVTPCSPTFSVPFSDNSLTNGGAAIASWNWNWGDGTANGTTQNPTHTYTSSGTKTVKLVVSNGACTDSITKTFISLQDLLPVLPQPMCVTEILPISEVQPHQQRALRHRYGPSATVLRMAWEAQLLIAIPIRAHTM